MWRLVMIATAFVSACAEFPGVDEALDKGDASTQAPELLPFESLLSADEPELDESTDDQLAARADALRDRADNLRGPVIDEQSRDRMEDGVDQP